MSTFASCRNKYHRAQTHFKSLERCIKTIPRANIQQLVAEFDARTGDKVVLFQGRPHQPRASAGLIIGDIVHNYRCALDHLASGLVEANGGTPTRDIAFPILRDKSSYNRHFDKMTKGMSLEAKTIIDSEQPWKARNPRRGETLKLLSELDNIDKHRHIHVTLTATNGGLFDPGLPLQVGVSGNWFIHTGSVDDGTVLARIPTGHEGLRFIPDFGLSFGPGTPGEGESVTGTMIAFDQLVADIINGFDHVVPIYH